METQLTATSKFLSLILRHKPETIGLRLTTDGWVSIDSLISAAVAHGKSLDRDLLLRVVNENNKQRFAISEDGTQIRANQGHSIDVRLGLEAQRPPDVLYHGTVPRFVTSIQQFGLHSGSRQHVHLSADTDTANAVGRRRGTPVVLTIDSRAMYSNGIEFYLSQNSVWLTCFVPIEYIAFPEDALASSAGDSTVN